MRPEGPCPWEEGFEPPRPSDMKDYEVFSPFSSSFFKMLEKMFEIEKCANVKHDLLFVLSRLNLTRLALAIEYRPF